MKEFGKTHFKYTAYVNFDNNKNMANVFESDYDIDRILMAINVETDKNLKAKSLRVYCDKFKPKMAIRTSMSNYREQEWMVNVPLYILDRYIETKG